MPSNKKPKIFKRRVLRRKDANSLKEEASSLFVTGKHRTISRAELEDGSVVYLFDGEILLTKRDGVLLPTLKNLNLEKFPSVNVDMGAIPYVCNGADVMAPGIVEIRGEFEKDDLLIIRDVQHGKALGVGLALVSSGGMKEMKRGKAVVNLHHVGDKLWDAIN
jgi:PUA domain protein